MHTIEIDFDVFKKLTLMRDTEAVSYNDVIRSLLGFGPSATSVEQAKDQPANVGAVKATAQSSVNASASGSWVVKNVTFPSGTEFRATHRGKAILGRVEAGALAVNGKRYESPSAAAVAITGTSVNGWIFWECKRPGSSSWQLLKSLRR
jgi:hypothetical protein